MPNTHKKQSKGKGKNVFYKQPFELFNETPKIDWEKLEPSDVTSAVKEVWYNSAADAVRKENVEVFRSVLKTISPVSDIIHVFQLHRHDFSDIDIIKIAVVTGCKVIVECMVFVLGEEKFYEFARWGQFSAIHIAAMWGHVELVEMFHDHYTRTVNADPLASGGETVISIARRYDHQEIIEYYAWCDLCRKYSRLLESLLRHIKKAVPQHEPVFTEEDLDRYHAGCTEKLEVMKKAKFHAMPTAVLLEAVREACELRFKIKTFLPKPEDLVKGRGKKGAKGKKK